VLRLVHPPPEGGKATPLAERQRRCVVRCIELTPGEEIALLQRTGNRAGELRVGLTAKRGGAP
jgi:hypothetical protein